MKLKRAFVLTKYIDIVDKFYADAENWLVQNKFIHDTVNYVTDNYHVSVNIYLLLNAFFESVLVYFWVFEK